VTCPASFAVCCDDTPITLSGATPAGGTYSGEGVSAGVFTPSCASPGPKTITYTYTDGNGCTNSCTFTITVNPLPNVVANPVSQPVCHNTSTAAITFTGSVTGTVFNWTNDTPSIGLAGSGSGNIASFIAQNPGILPVTATITVEPTANGCIGPSITVTITVNPIPALSSSLDPLEVCSGAPFYYHPTSGTPGTSFTWTRAAVPGVTPDTGSGTGDINETLVNSWTIPRTVYYLIYLSANGCSNPTPYTLEVTVNPIPDFTSTLTPSPICSGSLFSYIPSSSVAGATFAWTRAAVPGIAEPASSGTGNVSEVLTNTTPLPITVTYAYTVSFEGCTNPAVYNVQVVVRPIPVLTSSLTPPGICSGNIFSYTPTSSTPLTSFAWTRAAVAGILEPAASGTGNPNEVLTNTTALPITVTYVYILTASGCTNPVPYHVEVVVSPLPVLTSTATPDPICSGTTFSYTPASSITGTTFSWVRPTVTGILPVGTSGTGNISEVLINTTPLPIAVTYNFTLTAGGCTNPSTFSVVVVVNPTPVLTSGLGPFQICSGTLFSYDPTSSTPGTTFAWSRAAVPGISNPPASGMGNPNEILINTTVNPILVTYVYTLTANGCSNTQNVRVRVRPTPTVNPISDKVYCNGASVPQIVISGSPPSGVTYSWINNNTAIGLGPSGTGNIPPFIATNPGTTAIIATITVTPSTSFCTGTPISFTITVNPTPALTSTLTPPPICSGTVFNYEPTGNVTGTTFNWTRAAVSGISNPAGSGTGNPMETLINTTALPVAVTYLFTPAANGCSSPAPYPVVVIVNPVPTLTSTLTPSAICSNTLFSYNPTSGTPGTTFNWSRPAVAGISNPAAIGTDNPNEILINTTSSPINVTYIYTLTASGCSNDQNVVVSVKPTPSVDPIGDQDYCHGDAVPETPLTGPVSGTIFTWTNSNTSIGLGAGGTGNIPAFTATNLSASPTVAVITITPSANGCSGPVFTYTITVYPSASVNPVANQVYCSGDLAPATPLTGPIPGTVFNWTNSNPAIGLPASGTGDVPAFTAMNPAILPITATITITPVYGTCPGITASYTITVSPMPTADPIADQEYCEGALVPQTVLTANINGTTYTWSNDNTGIGLAAGGTGNIPSFTATNSSPNPITATITIIPWAYGCDGPAVTYTITVNPNPELSSSLDPVTICSESQFYYIATSLTTGTVITWYRAEVFGISNPPGSGNDTIDEYLENTTTSPITVTYEITLIANGCTHVQNLEVVVAPIPTMYPTSGTPTVCSNTLFTFTPDGPVAGTLFSWTRAAVPGIANPPGSGTGTINEVLINTTTGNIPVTYEYTLSTAECTNPIPVYVTVVVIPAPEVTASASVAAVCPGEWFNLFSTSNLGTPLPTLIYSEDFNTGTAGSTNGPNGWTTTLGGGTPTSTRWTLRDSPYNNGWVNVNSGDGLFYHANSRAGGFFSSTNTSLVSPSISITSGYSSLTLTFRTYYDDNNSGDYGYIDVNDGSGWDLAVATLNSDYGSPASFATVNVNLSAYILYPNIQIRFRYSASRDRYWAIDNVTITGESPSAAMYWTGIPALPPGFPVNDPNPINISQTVTTTYIATYYDASIDPCPGSDTVTVEMHPVPETNITADYCSVPGHVILTAHPDPPGYSYLWNTGDNTQSITIDEVGIYSVTVTNSDGCSATNYLDVSNELVVDGSFTGFIPSSPTFFTEYTQNQAYYNPAAPNPTLTGLWPEGYYAVNTSAWYNPTTNTGYHPNFHGRDYTNNTIGPRNFMMVNGSTDTLEDPPGSGEYRQMIIWQQTVAVAPYTDYYFSAWAMNLNPVSPARLQFEVNGVLVGSIADLNVAPKPTSEAEVSLSNWVRFYSTPFWNSGTATTAVIRIRNLNTIAGGNDFGLDDISFGTLSPIPADIEPTANHGDPLCELDTLFLRYRGT